MAQLAAILVWFDAIGLAIPGLIGVRSLLAGRGVPVVLGYPSYGGGPSSEPASRRASRWLRGAVLALVLLLPEAIFWWGFDLPFPPVLAVLRVVAIALAWASLRA